jgi:hypothetical protein
MCGVGLSIQCLRPQHSLHHRWEYLCQDLCSELEKNTTREIRADRAYKEVFYLVSRSQVTYHISALEQQSSNSCVALAGLRIHVQRSLGFFRLHFKSIIQFYQPVLPQMLACNPCSTWGEFHSDCYQQQCLLRCSSGFIVVPWHHTKLHGYWDCREV